MEQTATGLAAITAAFDTSSVEQFVTAGALVGVTIALIFLGWKLSKKLSDKTS
jgi:hypothetical protein